MRRYADWLVPGLDSEMINLEEEARKRRERLKLALSGEKESEKTEISTNSNEIKVGNRKRREDLEDYSVPEGEVIHDSTGAEILGLDSRLPDTLEAQVKSLLSPQNDLIPENKDVTFDTKMNSDLKREYERRMTRLGKETRRSVVDIVRARLEREKQESEQEVVEEQEEEEKP